MALTEIQLPNKSDFYASIRSIAREMDTLMARWAGIAEFIARMDLDDMDAMGVAEGQVLTDLVNFRVAMEEVLAFYEGEAVTATNAPNTIMDAIRSMG